MTNLEEFAERELRLAGLFDEDADYGGMTAKAVMELIHVFSNQGHSGASAAFVGSLFEKLCGYEPITPLTGADDEWNKVDYGCEPKYQNKRCPHVFKDSSGRTYDTNGRVYEEPDGSRWRKGSSSVDITFPYTPKVEYIKVNSV